jgi:hypothetical protein
MFSKMTSSLAGTLLRSFAAVFVWGVTIAVLHNLNLASVNGPITKELVWAAFVMMVPSAIIVSNRIMRMQLVEDAPRQLHVQTQQRTAADSLSTRDLMALLSDDDLADLRGEMRESLRARIRRLSEEEPESFGDLLAEASAKRKRR